MHLEGIWPVYRKDKEVGQCRFQRQGLYWLVDSQCTGLGAQVCRLWLTAEGSTFNLGIPVPEGDGLSLRRRIAIKGLNVPGAFRLELKPWAEPGVTSRDEPTPSHASAEPEATRQEEASPICPAVSTAEEPPAVRQTTPEETAPQPESSATKEPDQTTAKESTEDAAEAPAGTITAALTGVSPGEPANPEVSPETKPVPEETATEETTMDTPTAEETADKPEPDESASEPAAETAATTQTSSNPEPPETAGIPYDPQKPLPPLGNWENLRAVSDGHGGLLICTAGEDKVL